MAATITAAASYTTTRDTTTPRRLGIAVPPNFTVI
jgi:hypothetical protein